VTAGQHRGEGDPLPQGWNWAHHHDRPHWWTPLAGDAAAVKRTAAIAALILAVAVGAILMIVAGAALVRWG